MEELHKRISEEREREKGERKGTYMFLSKQSNENMSEDEIVDLAHTVTSLNPNACRTDETQQPSLREKQINK